MHYVKTSFLPTFSAPLYRWQSFNESGEAIFSDLAVTIKFSYVNFYNRTEPTSIRTDKSGSKSRASEKTSDLRIMVFPDVRPEFNDELAITQWGRYRVIEVFPRYEMSTILNHYQVDLMQSRYNDAI